MILSYLAHVADTDNKPNVLFNVYIIGFNLFQAHDTAYNYRSFAKCGLRPKFLLVQVMWRKLKSNGGQQIKLFLFNSKMLHELF